MPTYTLWYNGRIVTGNKEQFIAVVTQAINEIDIGCIVITIEQN